MLLSVSSLISKPFSSPFITTHRSKLSIKTQTQTQVNVNLVTKTRCELNLNEQPSSSSSSSSSSNYSEKGRNKEASSSSKLGVGSPVIITEAPKMIKTAASVPCLRVNADLVKPGDVGRIVSRKPMDVWAIRLSIGTYLIDRKYFKALELDD
uniref:Chlororespiratory reduction 42 n=1 Tax=Opuntia streptacantha TaxID=393608 RepID=A0A7C9DRN0_OPUST